jgi:thioredoxin-like negative regulator of GroEL
MQLFRIAVALVALVAASAASVRAVEWRLDVEAARSAAAAANRPVLVDFWASWCVPCRTMDLQTWDRPEIAAATRGFVLARSDASDHQTPAGEFYAVQGLPTLLVLDRRGRVALRVLGPRRHDELERLLLALPARMSELDSVLSLADAPVQGTWEALARAALLSRRACYEPAAALYAQLRRRPEVRGDDELRERVEYLEAGCRLQGDPPGACGTLIRMVGRAPGGAWRRQELAALVHAMVMQEAGEAAEHYLGIMQQEFPGDSLTARSRDLVAGLAKR